MAIVFHEDNAPVHTCAVSMAKLHELGYEFYFLEGINKLGNVELTIALKEDYVEKYFVLPKKPCFIRKVTELVICRRTSQ